MVTKQVGRGLFGALLWGYLLLGTGGDLSGQQTEFLEPPEAAVGLSLLTTLNTSGRALEGGASVSGDLSESDLLLPGGERVQGWNFEGLEGERVQIDLSSDDFDSFLYLAGPGLGAGHSDDDGGDGLDSRICARLPATGRYTIAASSLGGGTGSYTISLQSIAVASGGATASQGCVGSIPGGVEVARLLEERAPTGVLRPNVEVTGLLDPFDPIHPDRGGPLEIWEYVAAMGERLAFDLASDDLDTYLYLVGPGLDEALADDDSGVGCTGSRIWLSFPASGTYRAIVTTFSEGEEGAYRLIATASPTEDLDCDWSGGVAPPTEELDLIEISPARRLVRSDFPTVSRAPATPERARVSGLEIEGNLSPADHRLESGGLAQGWSIEVLPGERFRIDLDASDFDPYLIVYGSDLEEPLWSDDDGGDLNSSLEVVVGEAGVLRVIVGRSGGEGEGSFRLRIVRIQN